VECEVIVIISPYSYARQFQPEGGKLFLRMTISGAKGGEKADGS